MEQGKLGRLESTADNRSRKIKTIRRRRLQTPDLPAEIIQDILLRLPVKSLSRSKCVSKSWLALISSPRFVKSHLKLSAENADFANHRVILSLSRRRFQLMQCSVSSLMSQPQTAASQLDYPRRSSDTDHFVVGCCNGIVCIAIDENSLVLLNPSTGKTKELPSASVEMEPGFISIWGFGYTESDDDYKVVGIFDADDDEVLEETMVKVYSLRANSWKRVDYLSCGSQINSHGKFANGKLHFSSITSCNRKRNIVSFDLNNCNWDIVEEPNYGGESRHYTTLGSLGGCLTVLCNDYPKQRVVLWVMKEYGVKESWTRLVSIRSRDNEPCYHPLMIMPNGEFLVLFNMNISVYNPEKDRLRRVRVQMSNDILHSILVAEIYCESLVPL